MIVTLPNPDFQRYVQALERSVVATDNEARAYTGPLLGRDRTSEPNRGLGAFTQYGVEAWTRFLNRWSDFYHRVIYEGQTSQAIQAESTALAEMLAGWRELLYTRTDGQVPSHSNFFTYQILGREIDAPTRSSERRTTSPPRIRRTEQTSTPPPTSQSSSGNWIIPIGLLVALMAFSQKG